MSNQNDNELREIINRFKSRPEILLHFIHADIADIADIAADPANLVNDNEDPE